HDMAAGLRLPATGLPAFVEAFTAIANEAIAPEALCASVTYDCEARLDELLPEAVERVQGLAPFGVGNPRPRLLLLGLQMDPHPEPSGGSGDLPGMIGRHKNRGLRLVGWNGAARRESLPAGATLDAIISPRISSYNGAVEPELD